MSSSKSKGNVYELEVKKFLEADGWIVFRQHRKPLYMKGRIITVGADIFGCDLIAKKKGEKTRWIQVGVAGAKSKKEDQLYEFPWCPERESTEIWLREKGVRAYRVWVLRDVPLSGGGQGQSFFEEGLRHVGHTSPKAPSRVLRRGAAEVCDTEGVA